MMFTPDEIKHAIETHVRDAVRYRYVREHLVSIAHDADRLSLTPTEVDALVDGLR